MAYAATPSTVLGAGYSHDADAHHVELTTVGNSGTVLLPGLTDVEAHATTGDYRKILFAIIHALWAKLNAVAAADRPTKISWNRSSSTNETTGVVRRTYQFTFDVEPSAEDVVDEA